MSARIRVMSRIGWLSEQVHVFNPVLYMYTKAMPLLITPLYNCFGVPGLVALPWVMLSLEKVAYDTFTAARGECSPLKRLLQLRYCAFCRRAATSRPDPTLLLPTRP